MAISPRPDAITAIDHSLLYKLFRFVNFTSFLNICQTSKSLFSHMANIHREVPEDESKLFKHQYNRIFQIREKLYYGDKEVNHFDYIILEDTFIKAHSMQLYKFSTINKICAFEPAINILFRYKNSDETLIELSARCKRSILNVTFKKRPQSYNCVDFIMDSVGLYNSKKPNTLKGHWLEEPLDESTLISGDIIALKRKSKLKHFAIYAINGIYLSKFGSGHTDILPSTLEEMTKLYRATTATKMTLK